MGRHAEAYLHLLAQPNAGSGVRIFCMGGCLKDNCLWKRQTLCEYPGVHAQVALSVKIFLSWCTQIQANEEKCPGSDAVTPLSSLRCCLFWKYLEEAVHALAECHSCGRSWVCSGMCASGGKGFLYPSSIQGG